MRYSEAIRLGGMMRPKAVGRFYDDCTGGVCVQGAALDACGKLDKANQEYTLKFVEELFPGIGNTIHIYDVPNKIKWIFISHQKYASIREVSAQLNNKTDWTREQIADWVEQMEDKYKLYPVDQSTNEGAVCHSCEGFSSQSQSV